MTYDSDGFETVLAADDTAQMAAFVAGARQAGQCFSAQVAEFGYKPMSGKVGFADYLLINHTEGACLTLFRAYPALIKDVSLDAHLVIARLESIYNAYRKPLLFCNNNKLSALFALLFPSAFKAGDSVKAFVDRHWSVEVPGYGYQEHLYPLEPGAPGIRLPNGHTVSLKAYRAGKVQLCTVRQFGTAQYKAFIASQQQTPPRPLMRLSMPSEPRQDTAATASSSDDMDAKTAQMLGAGLKNMFGLK